MVHEEQALLGAYVIGALDPDERRRLEAHLDGCSQCRADLAEHQQVSEGLLHLVRPVTPSAAIRAGMVLRLDGRPEARPALRRSAFARIPQLGFPILALGMLVLNGALILETRRLADHSDELLTQQEASQTALALASYSTAQTALVREEKIWGTFVYEGNFPVAVFNVWGLPQLPENQAYQLWLFKPDGTRASGAVFKTTASQNLISVLIRSPFPIGEVQGFGVTVEPETGSPAPTGPRIIGADFEHAP